MRIKFKFRWIPFFAATLVALLGIVLGQWQTRRGDEKQAIENRIALRESAPALVLGPVAVPLDAIEYAKVTVRGSFNADWPLFLDNRPQNGQAGFYVLMPLQIDGSTQHVLVERGWVARNLADRTTLPALMTPTGVIEIEGLVKRDVGHVMQLGKAPALSPGAILQNVTPTDIAAASHLAFLPYVLEQHSALADGLVRDWPRPSLGIDKHRGYAFQWYGLALTALLFFLVTGWRRGST